MRLGMQYGLPVIVLVSSSQFASALCVYWCTTNMISLLYAGLFKLQPVRNFFNIPPLVKHDARTQSVRAAWADYKAKKNAPPTLSNLRKKDQEQFRKAGSGKPMVF
ncbi:hypothetical protein M3Y99_00959300 [Aphelenchoides fujianensis]|nr:hypothetical protein M3Y99_00959300 [Aphelenchoides fujianensis]